jgi:hypothetical protein
VILLAGAALLGLVALLPLLGVSALAAAPSELAPAPADASQEPPLLDGLGQGARTDPGNQLPPALDGLDRGTLTAPASQLPPDPAGDRPTLLTATLPAQPFTKPDGIQVQGAQQGDGDEDPDKARDQAKATFEADLTAAEDAQAKVDQSRTDPAIDTTTAVTQLRQRHDQLSAARDQYFAYDAEAAMADLAEHGAPAAAAKAKTQYDAAKAEEWQLRARIAKAAAIAIDEHASAADQQAAATDQDLAQQRLDAIWAPAERLLYWMNDLGEVPGLAQAAGGDAEAFRVAAASAHQAVTRVDDLEAGRAQVVGDDWRYDQPIAEAEAEQALTGSARERRLEDFTDAAFELVLKYRTSSPDGHGPLSLNPYGLPAGWESLALDPPEASPQIIGDSSPPAEPVPFLAGYPGVYAPISAVIRVDPATPGPDDAVLPVRPDQIVLANGLVMRHFGVSDGRTTVPVTSLDDVDPFIETAGYSFLNTGFRSTNTYAPGTPIRVIDTVAQTKQSAVAGQPVTIKVPVHDSGGHTLERVSVVFAVEVLSAEQPGDGWFTFTWEKIAPGLWSLDRTSASMRAHWAMETAIPELLSAPGPSSKDIDLVLPDLRTDVLHTAEYASAN